MRMEDKIGLIETGKLADLIILEKNIFEVPEKELYKVRLFFTKMNGRVLFSQNL